jgi:hypothetical protein
MDYSGTWVRVSCVMHRHLLKKEKRIMESQPEPNNHLQSQREREIDQRCPLGAVVVPTIASYLLSDQLSTLSQ